MLIIGNVNRLKEVLEMVKTARAKQKVKLKAKQCKCIQCDKPAAEGRRGLCEYHYFQFDTEKRKQPTKAKQVAFDANQVRLGNILVSRRGKAPRSPNPFAAGV